MNEASLHGADLLALMQQQVVGHMDLFRAALFLCCLGYLGILLQWVRPSQKQLTAGALATAVQFFLGYALDCLLVNQGVWAYRVMPFMVLEVPLDLHLDWSLLWGFGLCWLSDRILPAKASGSQALGYIVVWTAFTLAIDCIISPWMVFINSAHAYWWAFDIGLLFFVQGFTLWLYRSVGKSLRAHGEVSGLGSLAVLSPWWRSVCYMGTALAFFFGLLPLAVDAAALGTIPSDFCQPVVWLSGVGARSVAWLLACLGLLLGLWATVEFSHSGRGTAIPWDAPRQFVVTGPYAYTANPMQQSGVLLGVALFLAIPSLPRLGYFLDLVAVAVLVAPFERARLQERYGDEYRNYRDQVRNWRWRGAPLEIAEEHQPILFFDAQCGLCRGFVRVVKELGPQRLKFEPLGENTAKVVLAADLAEQRETMMFFEPFDSQKGTSSRRVAAVLRLLAWLPLPWSPFSILAVIPGFVPLGDLLYRVLSWYRKLFSGIARRF